MKQAFFITGTDTDVGKTYCAVKLIQHYIAQGYTVVGMKPVAAGCEMIDGIWQNEDVAKLIAASNVQAPRELVNPYSFDAPIAPHIAAEDTGVEIKLEVIQHAYEQLCTLADIVIVEGAGGLLVPINESQTMADIAQALNLPVILVVLIKLGCINHTLLTYSVIKQKKLHLNAWIANEKENIINNSKIISFLKRHLGLAPSSF
jgi:dethiobiotin synthetase